MSNEIKMAGVKSAEEWAVELLAVSEHQGGIDSEQCLIPKVTEIQQDAYRAGEQAGMTEAEHDSLRLEAVLKEIERQSQLERGIPQAHAVAGCIEAIRRAVYAVDAAILARDNQLKPTKRQMELLAVLLEWQERSARSTLVLGVPMKDQPK